VTRALLLGLLLIPVAGVAQQPQASGVLQRRSLADDMMMFSQVLNQIRVNHPDSIDTHDLVLAAVMGMVRAADPHSFVIPSVRLEPGKERAFREGKLYPVPLEFAFRGGSPVVVSVASGSRAAQQDILPGDELVGIEGAAVMAESAEELAIVLAGPRNSAATLAFERRRADGSFVRLERSVRRERVEEETAVRGVTLMPDSTGYLRITTFANQKVAEDLQRSISELERQGMQRLLLDLRDNGGGLVAEAAHIAGQFLPSGSVVYTATGRKQELLDTGRVRRSFWRSERSYPVVVLVNEGTASASELVAGALQDHDRALIVGRPTFGKSLLMRGFPMTDGSIIVLVVGHISTPCGRVIQRQYRNVRTRDYYRLARAERDTAGRASCRTVGGRTVYGGGGIYPDVVLPEPEGVPTWLARIEENDVVLKWVGPYLSEASAGVPSVDALVLRPALNEQVIADFRRFAAQQGTPVPDGRDADARLQRVLVRAVVRVRFGEDAFYRIAAVTDPEILGAGAAFTRAGMLRPAR
jgi:carboxyl-terminal processing protease